MKREQREQYEQGGLQGTLLFTEGLFFLNGSRFPPWRGGETSPWTLPRTASDLQGTLPFLFAIFAPFAVIITMDTPFEFHEPRTPRRARTRKAGHTTFRGFRAFRG